jgi:hypothetical protein
MNEKSELHDYWSRNPSWICDTCLSCTMDNAIDKLSHVCFPCLVSGRDKNLASSRL